MLDEDDLVTEIRKTRESFDRHGTVLDRRIDTLEESLNDVCRRVGRPGGEDSDYGGHDLTRQNAIIMCQDRHHWQIQKTDEFVEYAPSSDEIADAITAQKACRKIVRHATFGYHDRITVDSLT